MKSTFKRGEQLIETTIQNNEKINRRKCKCIKNCIDSYLSKRVNLSLQNIAAQTTVPYSTLSRIVGLKGNPKPETSIKIYNSLGEDQLLVEYMKEFHPEITKIMNLNFDHNKDYKYIGGEISKYFTDELYFLILNLACTNSGTTEEEITYELGVRGVQRLNELVKKGLIIKDDNGTYLGKNNKYKLSFADTKKRVELALKYYKLEEAGAVNNWMSMQTESINEEGLNALKKLNQKHFSEIKEQILYNPMYNGNIKVYTATVSSTFLPYNEKGGLQ